MKNIIAIILMLAVLSGCSGSASREPVPSQCLLGNEMNCLDFSYKDGTFLLNVQNIAGFTMNYVNLKIEACNSTASLGMFASMEKKFFQVKCRPSRDSVLESNIFVDYEIDGTKYLRVGKFVADMKYGNFTKK